MTSEVLESRYLTLSICCACDVAAPRPQRHDYTHQTEIVGTVAADGGMKRRSPEPSLLFVAALFISLLVITAMSSLLLTVTVIRFSSRTGSSAPAGALPSRRAAHIYTADPSGFPSVQPPACTPPDTCQPISAAPPCCSRGRGASGVHGTALPLGSRGAGGKPASKAATAPLKRRRFNRYRGAAHFKARDQALPSGCLMREALVGWDRVAIHMCPEQMVNPICSHNDCDGQVGCTTARW